MQKDNLMTYRVFARRAMFSMPENRIGGEKISYQIPTYQAIKGITESIYWKPTLIWRIKRFRVINQIQSETQGVKPISMKGGNTLGFYTYLKDVEYEVEAYFEWNENRPDLIEDRNENKHYFMAKRSLEKGGRRDIFLGTRECQGYVEPCKFGEKKGAYDEIEELGFGFQFHSFTYPDEIEAGEKKSLYANFWNPFMKNGVIDTITPQECSITRNIKDYDIKEFIINKNLKPVIEEVKENGMDE